MNNRIVDTKASGVNLISNNGVMFQLLSGIVKSGNTWTYGKAFRISCYPLGCRVGGGSYEHTVILGNPTLTNVYVDCRGQNNGFLSTNVDMFAFGW